MLSGVVGTLIVQGFEFSITPDSLSLTLPQACRRLGEIGLFAPGFEECTVYTRCLQGIRRRWGLLGRFLGSLPWCGALLLPQA